VTDMKIASSTETTRQIVNDELSWTLGPEHRREKEYAQKIAKVGGPSRPPRK